MNLIETILKASGGSALSEIASKLNIDGGQATEILKQLAPALGRGISRNTADQGGLDALINALGKGNHERYLDNPNAVTEQDAIDDGNGILGHIFGSKEVSRKVATHASNQTGVSSSLIKKMLPMIASLAMGALAKQNRAQPGFANANNAAPQSGGIAGGLLNSFLDADKDGSIMDDLLGMAGKFLR
jgi:hypothetical protein